MHITMTDIVGEKRIDLAYLIKNLKSKKIAVVSMFSDNIQYEFTGPRILELGGLRNK